MRNPDLLMNSDILLAIEMLLIVGCATNITAVIFLFVLWRQQSEKLGH